MKTLQTDNRDLEKQVAEMEAKIESIQKREKAARDEADRKHLEDVDVLKKHNQSLRDELEGMLSIPVPAAAPPKK
jgi:dynein light intermediate chain